VKKYEVKQTCQACGGQEVQCDFRNKFTDEGEDRYDDSYIFITCLRCKYRWQVLPLYRVESNGKEKRIKIPKEKDNEPTG
jgi:hypothetical protein